MNEFAVRNEDKGPNASCGRDDGLIYWRGEEKCGCISVVSDVTRVLEAVEHSDAKAAEELRRPVKPMKKWRVGLRRVRRR